jgi:hypothetical protein
MTHLFDSLNNTILKIAENHYPINHANPGSANISFCFLKKKEPMGLAKPD